MSGTASDSVLNSVVEACRLGSCRFARLPEMKPVLAVVGGGNKIEQ